jgi:integrase
MMRDHIMPLLATRRMITIKRDDIAAVLLAAEGKGLGPQMRLHLWNFIHKILDDALEAEKIATNPVKKNLKPKVPKKVRRFLKPADAFDFLEKIKADHVAPAIWIMMLTGLRIGEMQGLTWGDVDFERSEIWVKRQWAKKEKRFKSLKNNKWVRVPLLPELQSYLEAYKASDVRPETPIVQSIKGQDIISYDTVEDGLKRLCRLHNIAPLAPHECRHTCSEIWIERGANITDIMRLLNHSSEASTKPYIHRTEERLSAVAKTGRPLRLVK